MLQPIIMFPLVEIISDITTDVSKGEQHAKFIGKTTLGENDTYIFHAFGSLAVRIGENFKKGYKLTINGKFTRFTRKISGSSEDDEDYDEYQDVAVKIIDINNLNPLEFITPLQLIKMPVMQQAKGDDNNVIITLVGNVKYNGDTYTLRAIGDIAKQVINMKLHIGDYISVIGTPVRVPRGKKLSNGIQLYESIVNILEIDYANTIPKEKKTFQPIMDLSKFRE